MRFLLRLLVFSIFPLCFFSCSDDSEGTEYLFDRSVQDLSVLRSCVSNKDTSSCYRLRFRIPIETDDLVQFHIWVDTVYIDDTTKSVPKGATEHSIKLAYDSSGTLYDTLDLTSEVAGYLDRDSLAVAVWCEYSSGDEGSVQHVYLHFGDDLSPSTVTVSDSTWTTGAAIVWSRPTDQTDYYAPESLSGPIAGYNIVLWAEDTSEDIRNLHVKIVHNGETDSTGSTLWLRHHRLRYSGDSLWIDTASSAATYKNYLRLVVIDGKGFDFDLSDANRYRMIVEGLKAEHNYTIGIIAWDSAGNVSGSSSVSANQLFMTTDSVAPVMATKLWVRADSAYPDYARLDSNRVLIYFSRSVDPYASTSGIKSDSVIEIPSNCYEYYCYRGVQTYVVDRFDGEDWETVTNAGGESEEKYRDSYAISGDTMALSATGTYVVDTIRWVVPNDTLIIRIRSIDSSGYYSLPLIDTIVVSPGPEADLDCPDGFVPVRTSDSTRFCIERYEHMNTDSTFAHNVLYSEAVATCNGISASGFTVSLCKSADWKSACLAQGRSAYGVIEEADFSATEFLYRYCNVGTDDSTASSRLSSRNSLCVSPDGIHDMPGSYQEWVIGPADTMLQVLRGSSYIYFSGESRASLSQCTTYSQPNRSRVAYTVDTVYLYREGSKVDTTTTEDTSLTLYKVLTQKDFTDTLQFFTVRNPDTGDSLGEDYAPIAEYRKGGETWLHNLANGLTYEPARTETVFLLGGSAVYKDAAAFYRDPSISFRCCAYPDE